MSTELHGGCSQEDVKLWYDREMKGEEKKMLNILNYRINRLHLQ